ncbi:MAG: energy-coupled thiamine transporter ThiT [Nitrososphaerales archaeon]|nr:energy-coupled thiamine transporter ThiT [Nitrososphaerales archaeon]
MNGRIPTRVLAEAGVMIALATALNAIKVFTFPEGGSITLGAMVPLLFFALRRGAKAGVVGGAVFGIIDVYFEPFVYNPFQFLLDYPLAFGALGLAGLFKGRWEGRGPQGLVTVIGVAAGIAGRYCFHFLSGLVFFASYAPAGESPALYSAIYNASYLIPEFVISAAVIFALANRGALKTAL